jgi:hypothetical protein
MPSEMILPAPLAWVLSAADVPLDRFDPKNQQGFFVPSRPPWPVEMLCSCPSHPWSDYNDLPRVPVDKELLIGSETPTHRKLVFLRYASCPKCDRLFWYLESRYTEKPPWEPQPCTAG